MTEMPQAVAAPVTRRAPRESRKAPLRAAPKWKLMPGTEWDPGVLQNPIRQRPRAKRHDNRRVIQVTFHNRYIEFV